MASTGPTFVDRVIGAFSPRRAMVRVRDRMVWQAMAASSGAWRGGRRDRRAHRGWKPTSGSANADTLDDLDTLRDRSRDLARNAPVATGALATVTTNVIGTGLRLSSTIDRTVLGISDDDARAWQAQAEREFALFAKTCDFTGVQTWPELQSLVFRSALESGDVLVVQRFKRRAGNAYGRKLQVIEADRLANPAGTLTRGDKFIGGIEHDGEGVPVRYHIANKHPGSFGAGATVFTGVAARDGRGEPRVLHLFDRIRPDQARGVPYLAPIISTLKQIDDYSDAELRAAVLSAFMAIFVTREDPGGDPLPGSRDSKEGVTDAAKEIAMPEGGAIIDLLPGEDVSAPAPGRPNDKFDPFMMAMLRQVGMALELPLEVLVKHFTASYSASRAALEMAWQFFRKRRQWMVLRICDPVYAWFMDEAVAMGRLSAPGYFRDPGIRAAYLKAEWIGPSRIQLDPQKEARADEIDLGMGVKTRAQIITERTGGDPDAKHEQLAAEERRRREDGFVADASAQSQDKAKGQMPDTADQEGDDEGDKEE